MTTRISDRVTTYNACVMRVGASKRVVVWENTSRDFRAGELLFMFGHEQIRFRDVLPLQSMTELTRRTALEFPTRTTPLSTRHAPANGAPFGRFWEYRDLAVTRFCSALVLLKAARGCALSAESHLRRFRPTRKRRDFYLLELHDRARMRQLRDLLRRHFIFVVISEVAANVVHHTGDLSITQHGGAEAAH